MTELTHYGVKGMKWGVRRSQASLDRAAGRKAAKAPNENYSDNQRKRDTQTYGKRGAKRVNRAMNKGDSISVARGTEKQKRDKVINKNKYVRQGGKLVGGGAAGAAGFVAANKISELSQTRQGYNALKNVLGHSGAVQVQNALNTPAAKFAIAAGAAKVGHMMSGDVAVGANMRAHGYDPSKA